MYITRIRLSNIRSFGELELKFTAENGGPRLSTLIIGKNGTLKTTFLRCLAVGLCSEADANALLSEPNGALIAQGAAHAKIEVEYSPNLRSRSRHRITTKIDAQGVAERATREVSQSSADGFQGLLVGYGIGLTISGPETFRAYRILDSVYSLFNYEAQLTDPETAIRRLRDYISTNKYDQTMQRIIATLGLDASTRFQLPKGGGIEVSGTSIGKNIPIEGLADGYRITFNWILDLFAWAMRANTITSTGSIQGILLLDGLEEHLHTSMQAEVLPRLRSLWPRLQIIATTHSPIVTLGASPTDVFVFQRRDDKVVVNSVLPDFSSYSAEDILVDQDLFDTEPYSPALNELLREYRTLASRPFPALSPTEKKRLRKLAKQLNQEHALAIDDSAMIQGLRELRKALDL